MCDRRTISVLLRAVECAAIVLLDVLSGSPVALGIEKTGSFMLLPPCDRTSSLLRQQTGQPLAAPSPVRE